MTRFAVAIAAAVCLHSSVSATEAVWVFFADKIDRGESVTWSTQPPLDLLSVPIEPSYLAAVGGTGATVRVQSRWLNAVSVAATEQAQQALRSLPFVVDVQPVRSFRRPAPIHPSQQAPSPRSLVAPEYGESFEQVAAVGAHLLHARDILGQGVRIAVMDAGFNWRSQRAFADLIVIAERDFLNSDDNVGDELDEPMTGNEVETGQNDHGTSVLSVLGGFDSGHLIGIAPRAEYLLAKTEDTRVNDFGQEVDSRTEEDRWIAALEWADSLGAQVVSSSLGWTDFDDGPDYTYADMDGATTLTTIAAELAVARGIVVVVAAGNEGSSSWHYITAPGDGPGTIAVGAIHPVHSGLSPFSSRGPSADGRIKPDVVAPGQQVVAATGGSSADPFALQQYGRLSGTSFATPIVSGTAALLLQLHPDWSPAQVADALRTTAVDLGPAGPDTLFGWGRVDVARASQLDAIIPDQIATHAPFPNPARGIAPRVHFPVAVPASEQVGVSIFNAAGEPVGSVAPRVFPAGQYVSASLAPRWDVPSDLADGVYFYVVTGSSFRRTGKLAVLRGP